MSGECSEIMNCNLQRYINHHNWTKHLMIFMSIYMFTFILDWYSYDSLIVEKFISKEIIKNEEKKKTNKLSYLKKALVFTIIIYLIFILSTKNEGIYLFTFIITSVFIIIGTIYNKSINDNINSELKKIYFISQKKKKNLINKYPNDKSEVNQIILIQNIIFILSIIIFGVLIIGSYKYYLKQYKDHKNWSWIIFWFGHNKQCIRGVK